jgi:hypothetical protein
VTLEAGTLFFIVSDFLLRLISPGLFRFSKKRILGKYTGEKGRVQNEAIPDIVNFPAIGTFLSDSGKKPVFKDSQETGSHREKPVEPEENDKQKRFIIFFPSGEAMYNCPGFSEQGIHGSSGPSGTCPAASVLLSTLSFPERRNPPASGKDP